MKSRTYYSLFRRGLKVLFRCLAVGSVVFGLVALTNTYRYGVSFSLASQDLLRQACLGIVRIGVAVYDPCTVRSARLAPDGDSDIGPAYSRIETVLTPKCTKITPSGGRITAETVSNQRIVRSPYQFRYQPYDEPRLHELRRKYGFDKLVAEAPNEFEGMVRLRSWCRNRFRRQDYQPKMVNFDALEVLDRDRHSNEPYSIKNDYDPCEFFPLLYTQVVLSVGHQARRVAGEHGCVEVWSNQFRKWVLMDAELDHHFEKAGVPLNGVELLDEHAGKRPSSIRLVRGPLLPGHENPMMPHMHVEDLPAGIVPDWFGGHLTLVALRNDWMTNSYFRGHPARSETSSIIYINPHVSEPVAFDQRLRPQTNNKDDFYWSLNQTEIYVRDEPKESLPLAFRTVTPNFDHYEISIDGNVREPSQSPTFEWALHAGVNVISVRSVNQFGIRGIESYLRIARTVNESSDAKSVAHPDLGPSGADSHHD